MHNRNIGSSRIVQASMNPNPNLNRAQGFFQTAITGYLSDARLLESRQINGWRGLIQWL